MKVATVIPVGAGRLENLEVVIEWLHRQTRPSDYLVIVDDGKNLVGQQLNVDISTSLLVHTPKHEPGMEQPRNLGVQVATSVWPKVTHAWFLDSDIVVEPDALELLEAGLAEGPEDRILVAPYDWLPAGVRPEGFSRPSDFLDTARSCSTGPNPDPRWEMFRASPPSRVYSGDLSAGLACFSGNLLWPINEFERVGGFWSELHHGRCEDGELGLRAVAMGVPISLVAEARGYHLEHEVNIELALERNRRDVPMLNERHPWVERGAVFLVDRDGAAFDVLCAKCQKAIPTIGWWQHAHECGVTPELRVA